MKLPRFLHRVLRNDDRDGGLRLTVGGKTYRALDWTPGSIRIAGFDRATASGERLEGTIALQGAADGRFAAEVAKVGADGEVGLRLLAVSPAVFMAMSGGRPR